jgi:pimeloyl-ACP methyl ester carboxylesterase
VLLHGAGASKDINWGFLADRLSERFTLVAPDLPGSGDTVDQDDPLTYDSLVAQVLAVADATVGRPFHLLGYSLGAHLAAAVAAADPAAVRSLTAIAGWVRPDAYMVLEFDLWQRLFAQSPAAFARFAVLTGSHPDVLATSTTEDVQGLVDTFTPILAAGTARQAEFITRTDLTGRLPTVTAPTHVIGLTADRQVPPAHSRALHAAIDGAVMTEIDAGHIAPWQQPQDLVAAVEPFLDLHY